MKLEKKTAAPPPPSSPMSFLRTLGALLALVGLGGALQARRFGHRRRHRGDALQLPASLLRSSP